MTKRDDFSAKTKRTLAARVGHRCSNPGCMRPTSGPALDGCRSVNVGQAAHITAAAHGGKRYDSSINPEERGADANGIWLCDLCAALIDKDERRYQVELLRKWKSDAEDRALKEIATRPPRSYKPSAIALDRPRSPGLRPSRNLPLSQRTETAEVGAEPRLIQRRSAAACCERRAAGAARQ